MPRMTSIRPEYPSDATPLPPPSPPRPPPGLRWIRRIQRRRRRRRRWRRWRRPSRWMTRWGGKSQRPNRRLADLNPIWRYHWSMLTRLGATRVTSRALDGESVAPATGSEAAAPRQRLRRPANRTRRYRIFYSAIYKFIRPLVLRLVRLSAGLRPGETI